MKKHETNKTTRRLTLVAFALITVCMLFAIKPIAQFSGHHNFADIRTFLGLRNFFATVSNLPFIILGGMGLIFIHKIKSKRGAFKMKGERLLWQLFFFAVFLVGLYAGYYHLDAVNVSLLWHRLLETIAFMALFSLIIMERVDAKVGFILSPAIIVAGLGGVCYWYYTKSFGQGDLRPYILVQLIPLMLIPLMCAGSPPLYTQERYVIYALGLYVIAKLLEHFDEKIFVLSKNMVSGHTLKHLTIAMGVYLMLSYLKTRVPTNLTKAAEVGRKISSETY